MPSTALIGAGFALGVFAPGILGWVGVLILVAGLVTL